MEWDFLKHPCLGDAEESSPMNPYQDNPNLKNAAEKKKLLDANFN